MTLSHFTQRRSPLAPLALLSLAACGAKARAPTEDAAAQRVVASLDLSDASVTYSDRWRPASLSTNECARCTLFPTDPTRALTYRSNREAYRPLQFRGSEAHREARIGFLSVFTLDEWLPVRVERGRVILERTIGDNDPVDVVFLQRSMTPGTRWTIELPGFDPMEVSVVGRETITVPIGTFDALRVHYFRANKGLPPTYYNLWFREGVGIVRAVVSDVSTPETWELFSIEEQRTPDTSIDGQSRPAGALRLEARALRPAVIGEPLPLQLLVFNETTTAIALPPIHSGSAALSAREDGIPPIISIEIEGPLVKYRRGYRECGFVGGWTPDAFVTVAPHEAHDIASRGLVDETYHLFTERTPALPGRYRARFSYDLGASLRWTERESASVQAIARSLPRGRFVSPWVAFDAIAPRKRDAEPTPGAADAGYLR